MKKSSLTDMYRLGAAETCADIVRKKRTQRFMPSVGKKIYAG